MPDPSECVQADSHSARFAKRVTLTLSLLGTAGTLGLWFGVGIPAERRIQRLLNQPITYTGCYFPSPAQWAQFDAQRKRRLAERIADRLPTAHVYGSIVTIERYCLGAVPTRHVTVGDFEYESGSADYLFTQYRVRRLRVPLWMPLVACACYPLVIGSASAYRRVRLGRRGLGQCPRCGYDLTGNTSGRCPECGSLMERVNAAEKAGA
jgi:hypothetical protein